jgi:hypothetical protein
MADERRSDTLPVVIIHEDGRTLSLDVPLKAPIKSIAPAIEDHFKLAASSQVLKYNGDALQTNDSLQSAGALLLPGEPYVKLHLQTARGNMVALVGTLPNGKEVPLSVHETTTFRDVKAQFCDGTKFDPHQLRMYYRYNELHDTATPQYYRLPNNAKIEIVRKPDLDLDHLKEKSKSRVEKSNHERQQELKERREAHSVKEKKSATVQRRATGHSHNAAQSREEELRRLANELKSEKPESRGRQGQSQGQGRNRSSDQSDQEYGRKGTAGTRTGSRPSSNARNVDTSYSSNRGSDREGAGKGYGQGGSGLTSSYGGQGRAGSAGARQRPPSSSYSATGFSSSARPSSAQRRTPIHTQQNRPKAFYEVNRGSDSDSEDDLDENSQRLKLLKRTIAQLQGHVVGEPLPGYKGSPRKVSSRIRDPNTGDPVMDGTIESLRRQVKEADSRYQEALERIAELEGTIQRYQSLLRKAVNSGLMPYPAGLDMSRPGTSKSSVGPSTPQRRR